MGLMDRMPARVSRRTTIGATTAADAASMTVPVKRLQSSGGGFVDPDVRPLDTG